MNCFGVIGFASLKADVGEAAYVGVVLGVEDGSLALKKVEIVSIKRCRDSGESRLSAEMISASTAASSALLSSSVATICMSGRIRKTDPRSVSLPWFRQNSRHCKPAKDTQPQQILYRFA